MDDVKIIELTLPVEFGGKTYDKIVLREPTAGEVVKAFNGATGLAATILLVSIVSDIPRGAIEKVGISKVREASEFLELFTSTPGPAIGEN